MKRSFWPLCGNRTVGAAGKGRRHLEGLLRLKQNIRNVWTQKEQGRWRKVPSYDKSRRSQQNYPIAESKRRGRAKSTHMERWGCCSSRWKYSVCASRKIASLNSDDNKDQCCWSHVPSGPVQEELPSSPVYISKQTTAQRDFSCQGSVSELKGWGQFYEFKCSGSRLCLFMPSHTAWELVCLCGPGPQSSSASFHA